MRLSLSSVKHGQSAAAEFRTRLPDNLLRVECAKSGGVLVQAARDNFSPAHRRNFVHYLKAEGFIPEAARLAAGDNTITYFPASGQVVWMFDPSWPYADHHFNHYSLRLCKRLLLWSTVLWMLFMWIVLFR